MFFANSESLRFEARCKLADVALRDVPPGQSESNSKLSRCHYLRTIGYTAWIEDTYGNQIEETALKVAIKLGTLPNDSNRLLGI